jgi:hypothetical protein
MPTNFIKTIAKSLWAFSPLLASAGGNWFPEEVGITLYLIHGGYNSGSRAWDSETQGPYGLWKLTSGENSKLNLLLAAPRLSTGKQGAVAGLVFEYYGAFASLGVVHGYEKPT